MEEKKVETKAVGYKLYPDDQEAIKEIRQLGHHASDTEAVRQALYHYADYLRNRGRGV